MSQLTLFELPGDPFNGTKHPARPVTPALIGSGPAGETCRTCRHRVHVASGGSRYQKCELMRHHWTSGEGSDIKAAWSACRYWAGMEETR
jgi:hypothetical protein